MRGPHDLIEARPECDTPESTEETSNCCNAPFDREGYCTECEPCPHDEHDHGECLSCGENIMDDLIGAAESAFEGER